MTETWPKDHMKFGLQHLTFNKNRYKFSNINRENKQGGGIGLLYDKTFRIDFIQQNYRPETFT